MNYLDDKARVDFLLGNVLSEHVDNDVKYLSVQAPNIIEWVTGTEYWNVPTTFKFWGSYQMLRDLFGLRCRLCNPQTPDAISCWGKSRDYLESENLLVWDKGLSDFVCPRCRTTMNEFIADGIVRAYNEAIAIIGMRAGKSFTGAHIGGYIEHLAIALGVESKGLLQGRLGQEKSEWFEINYAASTEKQAERTIYTKYRQLRNNSPWIKRYMAWVKRKEKLQDATDPWEYRPNDDEIVDGYLQLRINRVPSNSAGIAGASRIATFLDEWARLINTDGSRSAWELYRVLNQGLRTVRSAVTMDARIPQFLGFMCAITSPLSVDDPAMQTLVQIKEGVLQRSYGLHKATWEFNPQQPRELFEEEFRKDPLGAARDFGAQPPTAASPLVDQPLLLWKSVNLHKTPVARFETNTVYDKTGRSYVGLKLSQCSLVHDTNFYLFGDAGLTFDSFALVGGHSEWRTSESSSKYIPAMPMVDDTLYVPPRGTPLDQERARPDEYLVTVIDFCTRIVPREGSDVWFQSLLDVVGELRKKLSIKVVCFDHWNSESTIQQIRDMGIQSYPVKLRVEDFLKFREMVYNGRVILPGPASEDHLSVEESGKVVMGVSQEHMSGEGVALVELMKLHRSKDDKRIYNPDKGRVRGRDSDDLARCVIGLFTVIQNSVVNELSDSKKRRIGGKLQNMEQGVEIGSIYRGRRGF